MRHRRVDVGRVDSMCVDALLNERHRNREKKKMNERDRCRGQDKSADINQCQYRCTE